MALEFWPFIMYTSSGAGGHPQKEYGLYASENVKNYRWPYQLVEQQMNH